MIKQFLIILFFTIFYCLPSQAQPVIFINAGSRAIWGTNQELTISKNGECRYFLRNVNGPAKDSSFFIISLQQLDSIFQKAEQTGFFNLNNSYTSNAVDGAGIFISVSRDGKKHSVQLANTDVPAINELISLLNSILAVHRIRISYGQFVTK